MKDRQTTSALTSHCPTWRWLSLLTTLTVNLWKIKWLHFKPKCRPLKAEAHLSCQSVLGSGPEVFEEAFIMAVQPLSQADHSSAAVRLPSNPICYHLQHIGPQMNAQDSSSPSGFGNSFFYVPFSLRLTRRNIKPCLCVTWSVVSSSCLGSTEEKSSHWVNENRFSSLFVYVCREERLEEHKEGKKSFVCFG